MIAILLCLIAALQVSSAKTVTYNWNIGWVTAAPDGFERPVIGINGEFPCPTIDVNQGDEVVVNVYNNLGNQSTSLHWHGMHQKGTTYMDGTTGGTQCPIPPGSSLTYSFNADQSGTYWYHSHNMGQYPDGLWGPLIVRGGEPWAGEIDGEFIMTLTDWYHTQMPTLIQQYESSQNEASNNGDEPTPDNVLINLAPNSTTFTVEANKTYLFRIICVGNFPGHGFFFDQHPMSVVEVDGIFTEPYPVNIGQQSRVTTGQRQSVLIKTKNTTDTNYAFFNTMDVNMLFFNEGKNPPSGYPSNATAWLVYDESEPLPAAPVTQAFDFVDDVAFTPSDLEPLLEPVDQQIIINMNSASISGIARYTLNDTTYLAPEVPTFYSALTTGSDASNPLTYGHVVPFILGYNSVVEIVVNDYHTNLHPFHLHGHQFQTLSRTSPNGGYYDPSSPLPSNVSSTPMRRDTLMVQNGGHAVIRFRADNPGIWLFHCHIEWHTESGLIATMIEAPEMLQGMAVPKDHLDICGKDGLPTAGNSLGNTSDPAVDQSASYGVPSDNEGATYPPPAGSNDDSS